MRALKIKENNYLDSSGVVYNRQPLNNFLDDLIETGEWTPTLRGTTVSGNASYSLRSGIYTKIGNIVFYDFRLAVTSFSGGSGMFEIGGLPYEQALINPFPVSIGNLIISGGNLTGIKQLWNANGGDGLLISGNNNALDGVSVSNITSTIYIYGTGFYFATDTN